MNLATILHLHWSILLPHIQREKLEKELTNLQQRITDISEEIIRSEELNEKISKSAIDHGSEHELWRRAGREGILSHNRKLVLNLSEQEKRLKKRLNIA